MTKQTKDIQTYGFDEFCKLVQESMLEGFKFDFDSNQHYPTAFGTFYSAVLVKQAEIVQVATEKVVQGLETASAVVQGVIEDTAKALEDDSPKAKTKK